MHNRPNDFLTTSQREFLRAINYPMPITPPVRKDLDNTFFDQMRKLIFPELLDTPQTPKEGK